MKPKENKGYNVGTYDECQTPPYALDPLYQYIDTKYVWECAAGKRTLVRQLKKVGINVIDTDVSDPYPERQSDFFYLKPTVEDYTIVTNPPYSIKYEWLQRCYELDHPFALLMPVEMLGTKKGQKLFYRYGIEMIFMNPRVDFYMPSKGYKGGGAQFPTAWYTWKMNLPEQMNFVTLDKPKRKDLKEYWDKALGLCEVA